MRFALADKLRHGTHRAVDAPTAGLKEYHCHQSQNRGGQHHTVKPKGKLRHPRMQQRPVVGPLPGQAERPEQGDHLPEILDPRKDQVGVPEHLEEHDEKENQKTVSKSFTFHPPGDISSAGQTKTSAQQTEQLSAAAVAVAVSLGAADCGDQHRDKETKKSQPGEENVDESQNQVGEGQNPKIIIPVLFHDETS